MMKAEMGTILRFPKIRTTSVEVFELPNGDWVAGINLPMDGSGVRRFATHDAAVLFAQGFSEGSGLQIMDWSQSETETA
jgi:hypothetical protein